MSRCSCFVKCAVLPMIVVWAASPAQAQDLRVATWNIQTLTTGKKVFPTQGFVRTQPDLDFLANFGTGIAADAIALQEIASPAAVAQVFPVSEWTICISGQFFEAYPSLGHPPQADCFDAAPLPDTPASEPLARQFTAIAVRRSAGFSVSVSDAAQFGVLHRESDGEVRPVRWGLVATLQKDNRTFTLLNVHLKSGCFHGDSQSRWRRRRPTATARRSRGRCRCSTISCARRRSRLCCSATSTAILISREIRCSTA